MANTKISAYPDGVTPQDTDVFVAARAGTNVGLTWLEQYTKSKTAIFGSVSGDASATSGGAITLASVNANVGSFTNANITVNAKGLITAASSGGAGSGTVTSFSFTNGSGLTGVVTNATTTPALAVSIDASSIALGKIANQADQTILGNNAGLAGPPIALTAAQAKTVLALTKTDVGLSNVTNTVQTQASIVPNTAPGTGQILVGNAGGTAYAPVTVSGDITVDSAGATTIGALKVATSMIQANAVTLAKIANAAANSKILGSGAAGSGSPYVELTLGTNLSITGTTLNAAGAGGSITITDDTTTNATYYPLFATSTGSPLTAADVSSTKLTYNPSTGRLSATSFGGSGAGLTAATVALSSIANAVANSKLLGSGAAGAGTSYSELTLGTGLSITGTTLNSSGSGVPVDIQIFTASGTWTKPSGGQTVTRILAIGPGGPGASGRRGLTTVIRSGGGAGSGGTLADATFTIALLGATETVTVTASTAGGIAQTVDSTDGVLGAASGTASFGTWLVALGGAQGSAGSTATSAAGGAARLVAGAIGVGSGAGGNGTNTTGAVGAGGTGSLAGGGGGGAGAAASSTTAAAGGLGGTLQAAGVGAGSGYGVQRTGGSGGTTGGVAATAGGSVPANAPFGGAGGGGGQYITGTVGGSGANGGTYGGGGGGGGASDNGFNSGAGGNGAGGLLVAISW